MSAHFFGLPDGSSLLCAGSSLRLLSSKFDIVKEKDFEYQSACSSSVALSPDGRLFVSSTYFAGHYRNEVLLVPSLATVKSWTGENRVTGISQAWVLESCKQSTAHADRPSTCLRGLE